MHADDALLDHIRRTSTPDERRVLLRRLATCDADFRDGAAGPWAAALSHLSLLLRSHHVVRRTTAPLADLVWAPGTPAAVDLGTWVSYAVSHTEENRPWGAPALQTDPVHVGYALATRLGDARLEMHSRPHLIQSPARSRAVLRAVHEALLRPLHDHLVAPVHAVQDADAAREAAPGPGVVVNGNQNVVAGGNVTARQLLVGTGTQIMGPGAPRTEVGRRIAAWGEGVPDLPPAARQHIQALARAVDDAADVGDLPQPERFAAGVREAVEASRVVEGRARGTLAWIKTEAPAAAAKGALGAVGKAAVEHAPALSARLYERLHHLLALVLG